uniref:sialic acid-binding Ig-like lectin 8 isoform X1 n=1 Tax=Pristiophorus japonicus TaxID=55135 RepID=UPI00398ECDAF
MNRPGLSLLVFLFSLTGLCFTDTSRGEEQRIKTIYGVVKEDVIITSKYAKFSLAAPLGLSDKLDNSSRKTDELLIVRWCYYKHREHQKNLCRFLQGDRFLFSVTSPSFTAQLHIKGLQVTDAGFYYSVPSSSVKEAVEFVPDVTQLLFKAVPIAQAILNVPQLEVKKAATLSLSAIGFYPKEILMHWLKDGIPLRERVGLSITMYVNGTFKAMSTVSFVPQINDHGKTITCRITHKSMNSSWSQRLHVLYGPVNLRVEPEGNIVKTTGELLELTCLASSNPTAEMSWYRNSMVLLVRKTRHLRIRVHNISSNDQGVYRCIASNKLGKRQSMLIVTVIDPQINYEITDQQLMVIVISVSAVLFLVIVTSIVTYVIVRKCRVTGRPEEEPVYMVPSRPTADVYDTLKRDEPKEPSAPAKVPSAVVYDTLKRDEPKEPSAPAKASEAVYENVYRVKSYNPTTA